MAKTRKKSSKKAAKKKSKARGRPRAAVLTPEARQALLPGREGWEEIIDDVSRAMESTRLRVDGVTPKRLVALAARARKATEREEALIEKQRRALGPVADARRIAVDAAVRALLEVNATARFRARRDPSLLDEFAPLIELLRTAPRPSEEG
jgi:hypothetical protein